MGAVISEEVLEAIVNEYQDIIDMITENVTVTREKAPAGSLCLWRFDVKAKSHYLEGINDIYPKETEKTTFWVDVKEGYPRVKPVVYYAPNRRLASVNVFSDGRQCTDTWNFDPEHAGNNTSLVTVVQKTIKDIIHDPSVSRFDSMASSSLYNWQKSNIENHRFPTCGLGHVFKMDNNSVATNRRPLLATGTVNRANPPSLPTRPASGTNPPPLPTRVINRANPPSLPTRLASGTNPPPLPTRVINRANPPSLPTRPASGINPPPLPVR